MAKEPHLFTSESVTEGHPDKVADQISDAILDEIISKDPNCRVACETLVTTGLAFIAGEITTNCYVDMPKVVRKTIKNIGYNDASIGFDYETCAVITSIDKQSSDIAQGVNVGEGTHKAQGAGDQGMMFGFACDETPDLMPMPIFYAHRLTQGLAKARKDNRLNFLRPDGKSQVTIEYLNGSPHRVHTIVISSQHSPEVKFERLKEGIVEEVIKKEIPSEMIDDKTIFHINPTGRFVLGGPLADCGLTGRKIIVDTYGGKGAHGGGAFSGKDPSKVDRSASYMARYIAKNIVAAGISKNCEVQLAYAIGYPDPVSLMIEANNPEIPDHKIAHAVREVFGLTPTKIIETLDLLRPLYQKTACYGHFGRNGENFPWEKTDRAKKLKSLV